MGQINLKTTDTPQTPAAGRVGIFIATSGQPKAIDDEGTETPLAGIADAPSDGDEYVRKDGAWEVKSEGVIEYRADNTALFDKDYYSGTPTAPRSGNILFNLTGAKVGAATEMLHQDASAFTFEEEVKLVFDFDVADISDTEINRFLFRYKIDPEDSDSPYIEIFLLGIVDIVTP